MFEDNDIIIEAYTNWYRNRCLEFPTSEQIENFTKDGYWRIKGYMNQGYTLRKAFQKWDMESNK
jgi:hypothetical protein